jgi:hypothetical protein
MVLNTARGNRRRTWCDVMKHYGSTGATEKAPQYWLPLMLEQAVLAESWRYATAFLVPLNMDDTSYVG